MSKFLSSFSNFCVTACLFLTKQLTLSILFSTTVNAVFVAKLLTSGILSPYCFLNKVSQIRNLFF